MKGRSPRRTAASAAGEWIAGRRVAPFYVMESGAYRPYILLWADAASGLILGMNVVTPSLSLDETADALVQAIGTVPGYTGPPLPRSVRIADEDLAISLRARLGPGVTVRVTPTPELDEVMGAMAQSMGSGDTEPAYIETADTTPGTVAKFFDAARRLGRVAPWRIALDAQVLRLDAPAFGIDRAVVSIIGALRQNLGFIVFDSAGDYRSFLALSHVALETMSEGVGGPGVRLFSVNFEPASKLPAPMRREAVRHGWPPSARERWPWIMYSDADGVRRPVTARDYHFATACLQALTALFESHATIFMEAQPTRVRETYTATAVPGSPVLTLTAPHPEVDWDVD